MDREHEHHSLHMAETTNTRHMSWIGHKGTVEVVSFFVYSSSVHCTYISIGGHIIDRFTIRRSIRLICVCVRMCLPNIYIFCEKVLCVMYPLFSNSPTVVFINRTNLCVNGESTCVYSSVCVTVYTMFDSACFHIKWHWPQCM